RSTGRSDHLLVAAGMVAMFMSVENLPDGPTLGPGSREAFLMIERIDRQRFAGFLAGNQIVEITTSIRGPDLFDDHRSPLWSAGRSVGPQPPICHPRVRSTVRARGPKNIQRAPTIDP